MKIKELAEKLNITPRAIRFYEEKGLIAPQKEEHNQYRIFQEKDVWRLQTIIALRESGMSIESVKHALANIEGDDFEELGFYLELQRSVMFAKWHEIRETIAMTDDLIEVVRARERLPIDEVYRLAAKSKQMKDQRSNWQDIWGYDLKAADHDEHVKKKDVFPDYIEALQTILEWTAASTGEKGLDIGTGTGNLAKLFLREGAYMSGVDQSKQMLRQCRLKLPAMETKLGNFLALPYLEGQFDFIVSSFAFHHLSEAQQSLAIDEMRRVLKERGRICMADKVEGTFFQPDKLVRLFEEKGYITKIKRFNKQTAVVLAVPLR